MCFHSVYTATLVFSLLYILLITSLFSEADKITSKSVKWVAPVGVNISTLQPGGQRGTSNYYIARTKFQGGVIPGRVIDDKTVIYFGYKGLEHHKWNDYELLVYPVGALKWEKALDLGNLPENLFEGGSDPDSNQPLYICRTWHSTQDEKYLVIGTFSKNSKTCSIGHSAEEHHYDEFDVLVENVKIESKEEEHNGIDFGLITSMIAGVGVVVIVLILSWAVAVWIQKQSKGCGDLLLA